MPRVFIIIILFLGSAVIGLFYLGPAWQEFRNLRKETSNLQAVSAELDELINNRDQLIQSINAISKEDLKRVEQALPQGAKAAEFLVLLEKLALRNGLLIRRVDLSSAAQEKIATPGQPRPGGAPLAVKPSGAVNEFPFELTLVGSYESFKKFLEDLEKSLRLIDVQEVSFTAGGKTAVFDFIVKARAYYQ